MGEKLIDVRKDAVLELDATGSIIKKFIEFCQGADYLIHDCTYNSIDYLKYKNWGHSYEDSVLLLAKLSNVKNLILFHYSPDYDDFTIDKMVDNMKLKSKNQFNIIPAKEGEIINIL